VGDNAQKDWVSSSGINDNDIETSLGNKPSKKTKKDDGVADSLVQAVECATHTLAFIAEAIKDSIAEKTAKIDLPHGLFEEMDNLHGFELEHKSMYYAHLVVNPMIARTFMNFPLLYKISWVTTFMNEKM
jgi:hypothetical protein